MSDTAPVLAASTYRRSAANLGTADVPQITSVQVLVALPRADRATLVHTGARARWVFCRPPAKQPATQPAAASAAPGTERARLSLAGGLDVSVQP